MRANGQKWYTASVPSLGVSRVGGRKAAMPAVYERQSQHSALRCRFGRVAGVILKRVACVKAKTHLKTSLDEFFRRRDPEIDLSCHYKTSPSALNTTYFNLKMSTFGWPIRLILSHEDAVCFKMCGFFSQC